MSLVEATRCSAHSLPMSRFSKLNKNKQINKETQAPGEQPLLVLVPVPVRACRYRGSRAERVGAGGGWVGALIPYRKVPADTNRSCSLEKRQHRCLEFNFSPG